MPFYLTSDGKRLATDGDYRYSVALRFNVMRRLYKRPGALIPNLGRLRRQDFVSKFELITAKLD